jgi:hypothetical protein
MLNCFVGWDARETEAYEVCKYSLSRHSSDALHIEPVKHRVLRHMGLFNRPWHIDPGSGQWFDSKDGKPFSTEFSHPRFCVPAYAREIGITGGWVVFVDCDFLFLGDVAGLFAKFDKTKAVMVVKHRHDPAETVKMDGQAQTRYRRKNWSSLIGFNLDHPSVIRLTPEIVNEKPGSWLHGFDWCHDDEIGELSPEWNWIAGIVPSWVEPKAVHYTLGGPWWPEYANVPYAKEWLAERDLMQKRGAY